MPIFDFYCEKEDCSQKGILCEMLIGHDAKPICFKCGTELKRDFPAPKGYVKGTHNPVKQ